MFRKEIVVSIVCVLVLIGVLGCGQSVQQQTPVNYFPHNDGYSWEYAYVFTYGTVEVTMVKTRYFDGTATLPGEETVQRLISSEEVIGINHINSSSIMDSCGYYLVDDSGVYYYGTSSNPITEADLILPFPLEIGTSWQRDGVTFEVLGVETVSVPAGSFDAFKIGYVGEDDAEFYEWYADGVGLVKYYFGGVGTIVDTDGGSSRLVSFVITHELAEKNF